jgi:hypothetical protein
MSLHNAAKHIAAHGRGEDTVLVHMTPNEVSGLQSVAKAHGGSLTINPHTGLAEAGFLRGILPTLLGAGLAATGVGAPLAALMVGGGYTVASGGDLKKGLMAGLGAYGGAGMYGAVNPAATATAGATPVPTTPSAPVVSNAAPVGGPNISSLGSGTYPTVPNMAAPTITPAPAPMNLNSLVAEPAVGSSAQMAQQSMAPAVQPTNLATTATTPITPSYTPAAKSFEDAAFSKYGAASLGSTVAGSQEEPKAPTPADPGMIRPYTYERTKNVDAFQDTPTSGYAPLSSKERNYFADSKYTALTPYKAPGPEYMAAGGPVETMSNQAAMGANTMYPMANMATSSFATPYQSPVSTNMLSPTSDSPVGMNGEPSMQGTRMAGGGEVPRFGLGGMSSDPQNASEGGIFALLRQAMGAARQKQSDPRQYTYDPQSQQYSEIQQGTAVPALAMGGSLGGYSDGGRMLKGPGDGMSDNIPAVIGKKQPARLADGEFVVPADVVSHLGNGSTDAGAKQLYAMMDKIRAARTGTKKQGKQINPRKYMPA